MEDLLDSSYMILALYPINMERVANLNNDLKELEKNLLSIGSKNVLKRLKLVGRLESYILDVVKYTKAI